MKHTSNHSFLFGRARKLVSGLLTGLVTTGLLATSFTAEAQLALTSAAPVTENFDGLGNAAGSVPQGFVLAGGSTGISYTNSTNVTVTTRVGGTSGTNALNSTSGGGAYNFGNGVTLTSTDRALGFLSSGSYSSPRHLLLALSNNTGTTVSGLTVAYDVERYRTGMAPFEWQFYTSPDGSTWTKADLTAAYTAEVANAVVNPAGTTSKTITLTGLDLPVGATTYLRWSYVGTAGSTNAHALGLDNLVITPTLSGTPTPAPTASITTAGVATTSFCVAPTAGSAAFEVAYTSTGAFTGNYKVQLSDANGAFSESTTTGIIGSGSSSPISAVIPAGTPSGTRYRVRVLNDAPATYGTDNGTNLTVSLTQASNPVTVTPSGNQSVPTTGTGATLTASAATGSAFTWEYSSSAAGPYTAIAGATAATYQVKGSDFTGAGTYYLVARATITTSCGMVSGVSSPVAVTVVAPISPTISVSKTTLPNFGSVAVGAGASPQSFTVSGASLTGNITITPPAGFEIRTGSSPFACCAIVLEPVNGTVPSTTIEVRFAPTASAAAQAVIPVITAGLAEQQVAVTGTGVDAVYPATMSTIAVSDLTPTSLTTGGKIESDGGSAVTARGVVWSTTSNPVLGTTKTTDGAGSGDFTSTIASLLPGTTYYLRAYATNGVSTAYGDEVTFTTVTIPLAAEPTTPVALTAGEVTGSSLQLNLTGGDGAKRLVVAHLAAPVDAEPTDATTYTADAAFGKGSVLGKGNYVVYNGTGDNVTVTNLRPNTQYYFTVFAFNDNNLPYAENYLTTSPGTLKATTEAAPIALLLEENFDYPAGSLLTAKGWLAHSGAGSKPVAVSSTNLVYNGYSANSGHSAVLVANGEDVNRSFSPVYARTPAYVSFLVNASSVSTTGEYFFNLGPQVIGTTLRSRVFVRKDAAGKLQFGISSGSGAVSYTDAVYSLSTTYLVVLKYSFDEASSTSQLFINPTTLNEEPATASASSTETTSIPTAPNDNIGSVALRQGTNTPGLVVDGIRVGNTYRVVRTGLTCLDPVLTVPTIATVNSTADQCGASVAFAATATGAPAPAITYTIVKDGVVTPITSPYVFPVGTTTVTASADNECSTESKTFTVTVEDKQAPAVLTQPLTVALSKGTATITAAQVDKGSTDACGIASLSLDRTTFSCENIGENTVTLTVTDTHGNTATKTATVTVTGEIPTPAITVTPGSNVYTGGVATTLYLGYGPKSATLTATGGVAYSWSPATGLNNADVANPIFTPSTPGTFTFTVTATSASGCTATKSVTLTVVDVRCGNKGNKVTVCHNGNTLCIDAADVNDHLKHGDQLGGCAKSTAVSNATLANPAAQAPVFEAYPNPFTERTVVHFRTSSTGTAQLQIYNSLGQVVKTFYSGVAQSGQDYEFTLDGASLPAGLYTGRLLVNSQVQTLRLVLNK